MLSRTSRRMRLRGCVSAARSRANSIAPRPPRRDDDAASAAGAPLQITGPVATERVRASVSDIAFATLRDGSGTGETAVDVACNGVARFDALRAIPVLRKRVAMRQMVALPTVAYATNAEVDPRPLLCVQEPSSPRNGEGAGAATDGGRARGASAAASTDLGEWLEAFVRNVVPEPSIIATTVNATAARALAAARARGLVAPVCGPEQAKMWVRIDASSSDRHGVALALDADAAWASKSLASLTTTLDSFKVHLPALDYDTGLVEAPARISSWRRGDDAMPPAAADHELAPSARRGASLALRSAATTLELAAPSSSLGPWAVDVGCRAAPADDALGWCALGLAQPFVGLTRQVLTDGGALVVAESRGARFENGGAGAATTLERFFSDRTLHTIEGFIKRKRRVDEAPRARREGRENAPQHADEHAAHRAAQEVGRTIAVDRRLDSSAVQDVMDAVSGVIDAVFNYDNSPAQYSYSDGESPLTFVGQAGRDWSLYFLMSDGIFGVPAYWSTEGRTGNEWYFKTAVGFELNDDDCYGSCYDGDYFKFGVSSACNLFETDMSADACIIQVGKRVETQSAPKAMA